jgi:hypothetical protein
LKWCFSLLNDQGKISLSVAGDPRWDKRVEVGGKKDSIYSCSAFNGNWSQLTVGLEPMSQTCIKCTTGAKHDTNICSKNYEGCSKGTEAVGTAWITSRLFETGKVVIGEHVGDADSSYHAVMKHLFRKLIDAGKMLLPSKNPSYYTATTLR